MRVAFEPLERFSEYEDITLLEQTGLFDTVHVTFPKLGVDATAKVIRTEYDFINEKPISIELGNAKTNLLGLVDEQIENQISDIDVDTSEIEKTIGFLDSYVDEMTDVITNSLGLFATKVEKSGGGYQMYLHNRPNLADSQFQWTMNAGGFAVSQDGGDTWSAGIDLNGNAVFNSLAANIVNALKIYGSYIQGSEIVFGDPDVQGSKYITAKPYTSGVTFDGTGTIRMQPQEYFYVNNLASDRTHMYNQFIMNKQGSTYNSNYIELINRDDTQNYLMANFFEMDAHYNADNTISNRIFFRNYSTATGTQCQGNYIILSAFSNSNSLYLNNLKPNQAVSASTVYRANHLMFDSSTTSNSAGISNFSYNSQRTANSIYMKSDADGNYVNIRNYASGSSLVANSIKLESDEVTTIWSGSDLRLRSAGAVRIHANVYEDGTQGSAGQDVYISGKTIKLIKQGGSDAYFSLYTDGTETGKRYNIVIPSLSVNQTGNLQVTRVN